MKGWYVKMKKILVALLAILMLLGVVGCGSEKVPEGYMSVSRDNEIFNLYVPKTWQDNSASGISSAYYALGSGIIVSATTQKSGTTTVGLSQFVEAVLESYAETLKEFTLLSEAKETTLGGCAALTFEYSAKLSDKVTKFRSIIVKNENTYTTLTYSAPEAEFERMLSDFDGIVKYFSFRDFEVETDEPFIYEDEYTPEGYQLASRSKYEYRFFVPKTWKVDTWADVPTAVYSYQNLSNVSLSSFAVTAEIKTGEQYWNAFAENFGEGLTISSTDANVKMGGFDAYAVEFITKIAGLEYYNKQVFITTSNMIYIFTYTSDAEHYDLYLDDVNSMIEVFEFKK